MTGAVAGLVLSLGMIAPSMSAVAAVGYDFDSAASLQVVVNKHRQLNPAAYVPGQLVRVQGEVLRSQAADAYKQFAKAAKAGGVNVMPISGYRSFSEQASLYDSYVRQYGQATADTLAARPGYSEHQTGLAMDIGVCALQACFANTPAGQWAAEHGWEYGFIIRYPAGAQATTGYTYEPWHLRYVGRAIAEDMKSSGIATLEKYFGLEPAPDYLR
jgi:D-alanyl-D-alanine carboxypeptidase